MDARTAAVVLAGWIAATRMIGMNVQDHRIVFFGAGRYIVSCDSA